MRIDKFKCYAFSIVLIANASLVSAKGVHPPSMGDFLGFFVPNDVKALVTVLGGEVKSIERLDGATLISIVSPDASILVLKEKSGDIFTNIQKAGDDVLTTVKKANSDVAAAYFKGWIDASEQAKESFADAVEAGEATYRYAERQIRELDKTANNAAERVREGKYVDAMWGLAVEPVQGTERNFAEATQESKVIAAAAQSAAATYGGPAGAAAYASWSTYRTTGDANLALRAGILSAVTSQGGSLTNGQATDSLIKKAALAGAAGGIAVAAAGGDEDAITEGFLKSGSAVLVQAGSDAVKGYAPDLADAAKSIQCISARDLDCVSRNGYVNDAKGKILTDSNGKPLLRKFDSQGYLGKWTGLKKQSDEWKRHEYIAKLSKLKDMEAIPLMNNQWVLTWTIGTGRESKHNDPAVVLTYVGPDAPFFSKVTYGKSNLINTQQPLIKSVTSKSLSQAVRIRRGNKVISKTEVNGEMLDTYDYFASLALPTAEANSIKSVKYYFEAPTFVNPKLGVHRDGAFEARWLGWGCAYKARVVATTLAGKKVTGHFDMCEASTRGQSTPVSE